MSLTCIQSGNCNKCSQAQNNAFLLNVVWFESNFLTPHLQEWVDKCFLLCFLDRFYILTYLLEFTLHENSLHQLN